MSSTMHSSMMLFTLKKYLKISVLKKYQNVLPYKYIYVHACMHTKPNSRWFFCQTCFSVSARWLWRTWHFDAIVELIIFRHIPADTPWKLTKFVHNFKYRVVRVMTCTLHVPDNTVMSTFVKIIDISTINIIYCLYGGNTHMQPVTFTYISADIILI